LKILKVDRFEMPQTFHTKPMNSSRIAVRVRQNQHLRSIKLSRFQNFEIAKLHVQGIIFHVNAVLADPDSYNSIAMPMRIEYSQVLSAAANITRLLVLKVIEPMALLSSGSVENDIMEKGKKIVKAIQSTFQDAEELYARKTQHWLGINKGFSHLCPAESPYQSFQCNISDATIFTTIFDVILEAMGNSVIHPDIKLFTEMKTMIFCDLVAGTDNSKSKRHNIIVSMLDSKTGLMQRSAAYVLQNIVYHVSCAGVKNVICQKGFDISNNHSQDQAAFESCRLSLLNSLSKVLDLTAIGKDNNASAVMYGDLGCTFQPKTYYKNCLFTPLASKSGYSKIDIQGISDEMHEILDRKQCTGGSDEEEEEEEEEDGNFEFEEVQESVRPLKEEYELFFHSKMAGRRTGLVMCTINENSSTRLVPFKRDEDLPSNMLYGEVEYVSGSRESKDYLKPHVKLLQELPTILRGMCLNDGKCLTIDDQKIFDQIVRMLQEMKTFENVLELGNPFNLILRFEYFYLIPGCTCDEDGLDDHGLTFSMNVWDLLTKRIILAPKPFVAQNYYRTLEKSRQVILNAVKDSNGDHSFEVKNFENSDMVTSILLSGELLAYGPGTPYGVQIPFPLMRCLKRALTQKGITDLLYFPETDIPGITVKLDSMRIGPRYGVSSVLNSLPETYVTIINEILDEVDQRYHISTTNQNVLWKTKVETLIKGIQHKNFGGQYMKLSARKYQKMRLVAMQEFMAHMYNEAKKRMSNTSESQIISDIFKILLRSLANLFWISYSWQTRDDMFKLKMPELIENDTVPLYERSHPKLHCAGEITNYGESLVLIKWWL